MARWIAQLILLASLSAVGTLAVPAAARAQAPGQDEVLRRAFPEATRLERRRRALSDEERALVAERGRVDVHDVPALITYYAALTKDSVSGFAYFDAHVVRTHREVLMIVVEPDGSLRRIEVFRFGEPVEYLPPDRWLELFSGRREPAELTTKRAIPMITGATLTANAVTAAARRILILHALLEQTESEGS